MQNYLNNEQNTTWQNISCTYIEPATGLTKKGAILKIYEIEDKAQPPIDEVYETHSNVIPSHTSTSTAIDSCNPTCIITTDTTYDPYTETKTLSRRVWPILRVVMLITEEGLLLYDIPYTDIRIAVNDLPSHQTV